MPAPETTARTPGTSTTPAATAASTKPIGERGIDPRGPRIGAGVTAVLLAGVLLLGDGAAGRWLLALVTALFATGVVLGPARSVLGRAYATLVAPRLRPTDEREDPRPPRFAQTVGLVISVIGLALALAGVSGALVVAAGLALVAAFLNAAFGLCLGCELYLLVARMRRR